MEKNVYCELAFLREFVHSRPTHNDDPTEYDPVSSWGKLYQFICKSSTCIDITRTSFQKEVSADKELFSFYKRCPHLRFNDDDSFHDIKNLSEKSEIDYLNATYMTTLPKSERESLSKRWGVVVLGIEDVSAFEREFSGNTFAISKNGKEYQSWRDFSFPYYVGISNSMIVVDNYVLKDLDNLYSLLDNLLPQPLANEYDLTIYTQTDIASTSHKINGFKTVIEKIKKLRQGKVKIKIVICRVDKTRFHDRIIISNNVWIDCSGGFDLFRYGKATKRTNLRFAFPFMLSPAQKKSWENEAYIYLIKDIKKIESPDVSHTKGFDFWGSDSRINRILTFYPSI